MKTQERNKHNFKRTKNPRKTWNDIPAFIKRYNYEDSLYNDFFISVFWHIIGSLLLWGLTFLLTFWGISNILFPRPQPKMPDIEFILNNKAQYKLNRYNSNIMGTRKKSKVSDLNKNISLDKNFAETSPLTSTISDEFPMPIPKIKASSTGSGGFSKRINSSLGSESFINSDFGTENGSSPQGNSSGNGKGFNKENTRKIVSTYDISPYINELKRTIRWNWKSPKNGENKNVELFLRIAKDGKIIILNVKKTSEIAEVDNAALNAVRHSEPLSPLPAQYGKSYLDVIFTFNSSLSSISGRY